MPIIPALTVRSRTPVILKNFEGFSLFARSDRSSARRMTARWAAPLYRYIARECLGADIESHAYTEWLPEVFQIDPAKLHLVRNGANTDVFHTDDRVACRRRFGWARFDQIVGYVGAIDALRCLDMALSAAVQLRDVPGLGFVFVGQGPMLDVIRKRIAQEGIEDRVILSGSVPYADVPRVMSSFDVAIDLSRVPLNAGGKTLIGSFSQKIAQYLACGVPVVAWRTEDTSFIDDHDLGATVSVGDTPALARSIRELLQTAHNDPNRRERIRAYARENLDAEVIARKRMLLWEQLVSEQAPSGAGARTNRG
jgi:glycosyltransferase involved in cell wall biosynthesis